MIVLYFTLANFSYFSDPHDLFPKKAFFFKFSRKISDSEFPTGLSLGTAKQNTNSFWPNTVGATLKRAGRYGISFGIDLKITASLVLIT